MRESVLSLSNVPLSNFCTYHIGGKVRSLKVVYDVSALVGEYSDGCAVIGYGSKLLVSDRGYDGKVIVMRTSEIRLTDRGVYAQAGVPLPTLSRQCETYGKSGLQWACGIPGSVGGAIKLNAGAFGKSIMDVIDYVDVLVDGKVVSLDKSELSLGYRSSNIPYVILGASFVCGDADRDVLIGQRKEYSVARRAKQPRGFSCGSVFKNADKPAGWYVEQAGLKGLRCGGAKISEKHANFIVNDGLATSRDVFTLIRTAKAEVKYRFDVTLKEEVIYLGDFS